MCYANANPPDKTDKIAMNDQIFIEQLSLPAKIGVYDREKQTTQEILLDIYINFDTRCAADSDLLVDTLDYALLCQQLGERCLQEHTELVEKLADDLAQICLHDSRVTSVTLKLGKPHAIHQAKSVGVQITRMRR
jgi:dihydroneopterin aldolase